MNIPTVDSLVRVVMDFPFGASMIPPEPTTRVVEGKILPPHKWLSVTQFCMSGLSDMPIRVIDANYVKEIILLKGEFKPAKTSPLSTKVAGSKPGVFYVVTNNKGKMSCTCSGFQFRHACKHTAQLSK
jgi:hypothetical protein